MRKIINFGLERKLQIIQHLLKEKELPSIKVLAGMIKASEKTVRIDIKSINKYFPFLHIEITSKGQVRIKCPDYIGIEHVYKQVMDMSLEFKIFEKILMDLNQPMSVYTKEFFISESLFRRTIQRWNQTFENKKLPISISTYPAVAIEGDEIIIRHLFQHYLIEKYGGDFQSEFLKKMNSIWELISRMWNVLSMKTSYATHLNLSYWVFVSLKRIKQGYFIKTDYTESRKQMAQFLYVEISKDAVFMKQFMADNHIEFSKEILLDIMGIYEYDLLLMELLPKEVPEYGQKEAGLSVKMVKDFMAVLFKSVHYQDSSLEQTSIAVYNSLIFQNRIPFFFYDPFCEFKEHVKRESSQFYNIFEASLERSSFPEKIKQQDEWKNKLLYYVIIHSKSLLEKVFSLSSPKKVLILTTHYYEYMYWLKDKLENELKGNVEVSLYQSNQPHFEMEYLNQFDIILTNYTNIPKELESRIIHLNVGIPTTFWDKLKSALLSLD